MMFGNLRNGFKSLPWLAQAQTVSNKNDRANQILIGSIRPWGQLSCYYFPGKWPNNLDRCLHPLTPTPNQHQDPNTE